MIDFSKEYKIYKGLNMEIQIGQQYRLNDEILATIVSTPVIGGVKYVVYTYIDCYNDVNSSTIKYDKFKEKYESKLLK